MIKQVVSRIKDWFPAKEVHAHCDGPCGVYDPASARIAAEAVVSMTKKILDLAPLHGKDPQGIAAYINTMSRYIAIKEEQAEITKRELLILWTDYFKPEHLEKYPDLHDIFWKAAKLCSACKQKVSLEDATALMDAIKKIHEIFWTTKNREVAWYTAS